MRNVFQIEAAYDILLMQSLTRRRAGKVENSRIRYADVKPINSPGMGSKSQWLRNMPISIETPSTRDLGIQAGVYGALAVLTYVNGASSPSSLPYAGADVPGLILAGSFGASLYFMTKKNVKLGKEFNEEGLQYGVYKYWKSSHELENYSKLLLSLMFWKSPKIG